jgi:hypothetical protein
MHIAFLLTQGFSARTMLRTGLPSRLKKFGARITVISPNADEDYFQKECVLENLELRQAAKPRAGIASRFRTYRPYFLDDIDANPTLRDLHRNLLQRKPALGSTMLAINRTVARSNLFRQMSRAFECRLNRSKQIKKLLRSLKPNLLVLSSPFGTEESVYLLHAKELGIPVVCQVLSWDNITSKGTPLLMPDYFISWGPIMTQEIRHFYRFPKERIYECGVCHFDVYRQSDQLTPRDQLLRDLGLPPERPYLFYGTVAKMYCPNELQIIAWLADRINHNGFAQPCSLIIRPHPLMLSGEYSSSNEDLKKLKSLVGPHVVLDIPPILSERLAWDLPKSDMYRLASLLAGSAMCLNVSSTLCLDACMLDRPVVNIAFDGWEKLPYEQSARRALAYTHMAKLLAFGGVRIAKSFSDLEAHINAYLQDPQLDRDGRMLSVAQECGARDGRATERVANTLLQLAGRVH